MGSILSAITTRTPKINSPIIPAHDEMHPSQHQKSTTKPLDEARWLGFMPMVPQTEPSKRSGVLTDDLAVAQATPTRATQSVKKTSIISPDINFDLPNQISMDASLSLSPEAKRLMEETREEAAKIRAKMVAAKEKQEAREQQAEGQPVFGLTDTLGGRKIAKPKGRFSDAHKKQFGMMGSIADHASAFRADPNRFRNDAPMTVDRRPNKLLKRSRSKADLDTPVRQGPIKPHFTPIPARDPCLSIPAKRAKQSENTDVSAARPSSLDLADEHNDKANTPQTTGKFRLKSGIPIPLSTVTTPTKASIMRSQSVKNLKTKTSIPILARSPSLKTIATTRFSRDERETASPSPTKLTKSPSLRSILRVAPTRLYSDDPTKVAAGTHLPTPKRKSMLPTSIPAPAPVMKHVEFSESTKLLDQAASPTTAKSTEAFVVSQPNPSEESIAVAYPSLATASNESLLADVSARPKAIPKSIQARRQTMGPSMSSAPGDFTFRSGDAPSFAAPTTSSTIRRVRNSDVYTPSTSAGSDTVSISSLKKRKLDDFDEEDEQSDKENQRQRAATAEPDERPCKKMKATDASAPAKMVSEAPAKVNTQMAVMKHEKEKEKDKNKKRGSALSLARLNMLAMPKRRK